MSAPWLPAAERPRRCPIVVFCGKGGVGKTTLSLALALDYVRAGKRVVVVSSQTLADLSVTVSLDALWDGDAAIATQLVVTHIDPRHILTSLFEQQFAGSMVAQRVTSSRLYKNLIEVAPGIKELAFLLRVRELAETPLPAGGQIDVLIWDAPSTGHFLETLRVTQTFDTYLSGPLAAASRDLQGFFADRANLLLLPVTTLEEMAVEETRELWQQLAHGLRLPPAGVACNLVSPMLETSTAADSEPPVPPGLSPRDAAALAFVIDRHRIERHEFGKLRTWLPGPFYLVGRVPARGSDLDFLRAVAAQLAAAGASPA